MLAVTYDKVTFELDSNPLPMGWYTNYSTTEPPGPIIPVSPDSLEEGFSEIRPSYSGLDSPPGAAAGVTAGVRPGFDRFKPVHQYRI